MSNKPVCPKCGTAVALEENSKVAFREECSKCGTDLHSCHCCDFYDQGAQHECRESSAEPVLDKESANHCEYHRFKTGLSKTGPESSAEKMKKLDDLFK